VVVDLREDQLVKEEFLREKVEDVSTIDVLELDEDVKSRREELDVLTGEM